MKQTHTYHIHYLKLVLETVVSLLLVLGCIYEAIYFRELQRFGDVRYMLICALAFMIRICVLLFSACLKIEFDENIMTIRFLFFRKKSINFSDIKDFSVFQGFRNIKLYYIDNRKLETIKLVYFDKTAREEIANNIAGIMETYFVNFSDEQLSSFYDDKTQYNFTAIEKHNPFIMFLMAFSLIVTCITIMAGALTLFVIKPNEGLLSMVAEWWIWFNLIALIISFLLDKIVIKKRLDCKNGIITLYKNQKIVFSLNVENITKYSIKFNEFILKTKQPNRSNALNIMGFSRKERKELRNKLELFITFSRQ